MQEAIQTCSNEVESHTVPLVHLFTAHRRVYTYNELPVFFINKYRIQNAGRICWTIEKVRENSRARAHTYSSMATITTTATISSEQVQWRSAKNSKQRSELHKRFDRTEEQEGGKKQANQNENNTKNKTMDSFLFKKWREVEWKLNRRTKGDEQGWTRRRNTVQKKQRKTENRKKKHQQ